MNISNNKNSNNVQNNTEKNSKINTKNKKIIKISTNDTIFGIYNKKFEKHSIPRPNNKKLDMINKESLTNTFSLNKENSLENNENNLKIIEQMK